MNDAPHVMTSTESDRRSPRLSLRSLAPAAPVVPSMLDDGALAYAVILGAVCYYLLALALCYAALGDAREQLLPVERYAAQCTGAVIVGSTVLRSIHLAFSRGPVSNAELAMLATNAVAASSNLLMGATSTPVLVDPITGTSEFMVRWCEYTSLGFLMTFVVEAMSARSVREALALAVLMGVSTCCGLLLPLCKSPRAWGLLMAFAFATYAPLFPRLVRCRRAYHDAAASCSSASEVGRVVSAKVGHELMACCTVLWSLIVLDYVLAWAVAACLGERYGTGASRPQWPFVLDCVIDLAAKMLYAHLIASSHAHVPLEAERQQARWIREAMDVVWAGSHDTIVISELHGDGTARSIGSKGLSALLGEVHAREWTTWRAHALTPATPATTASRADALSESSSASSYASSACAEPPERTALDEFGPAVETAYEPDPTPATPPTTPQSKLSRSGRVRGAPSAQQQAVQRAFEQLIADAWAATADADGATAMLTWRLPHGGARGGLQCEVRATRCRHEPLRGASGSAVRGAAARLGAPPFLVLVLRDVSALVRAAEVERSLLAQIAEKTLLAERIGRKKDEEANRFSRHEVKNCVLAAIAQCEALAEWHAKTKASFAAADTQPLTAGLADLSSMLQRSLNTVLAAAMAKELANGEYLAKPEPTDVEALLRDNLASGSARFELRTTPAPLPPISLDPQLLFCVHRNAVSNAVKYGCQTSKIETEVRLEGDVLELRVTNAPGPGHAALLATGSAERVFVRGLRLHESAELGSGGGGAGAHHASADPNGRLSAGDGGWIMRRCAQALGGECSIRFEPAQTVFELRCPVLTPRADDGGGCAGAEAAAPFQLPAGTVCVGIDDSKVQRVILKKIFAALGADAEHVHILGEQDEHILSVVPTLAQAVRAHPTQRLLVIGDEHLDLAEGCACTTVSCSRAFGELRALLAGEELERVLLVIRSANDSRADVERYRVHAHGVLPKRGFAKQPTIDAVRPLWEQRFEAPRAHGAGVGARPDAADAVARLVGAQPRRGSPLGADPDLLCEVSRTVSRLCRELSARGLPWAAVRRHLISLKGELVSLNAVLGVANERVSDVVRHVDALLEHRDEPPAFWSEWHTLLAQINAALEV